MDYIRVMYKSPGKPAEVREIENTLQAFQQLVGGHIEAIAITDDIFAYIHDEGKLAKLAPNFVIPAKSGGYDIVCGPAVFVRAGDEESETSLTLTDIIACNMFTRKYAAERCIVNGRPLSQPGEEVR